MENIHNPIGPAPNIAADSVNLGSIKFAVCKQTPSGYNKLAKLNDIESGILTNCSSSTTT
jgi:hypothetical protein